MNRRGFLRMLGLAPAAAVAPIVLAALPAEPAKFSAVVLGDRAVINASFGTTALSAEWFNSMVEKLRVLIRGMNISVSDDEDPLLLTVARLTQLSARLSAQEDQYRYVGEDGRALNVTEAFEISTYVPAQPREPEQVRLAAEGSTPPEYGARSSYCCPDDHSRSGSQPGLTIFSSARQSARCTP